MDACYSFLLSYLSNNVMCTFPYLQNLLSSSGIHSFSSFVFLYWNSNFWNQSLSMLALLRFGIIFVSEIICSRVVCVSFGLTLPDLGSSPKMFKFYIVFSLIILNTLQMYSMQKLLTRIPISDLTLKLCFHSYKIIVY